MFRDLTIKNVFRDFSIFQKINFKKNVKISVFRDMTTKSVFRDVTIKSVFRDF